ncbi:MAG: putative membrane protein YfcA [Halieaceae bacterium]|jgi:uncharacterized membrane protein YfcA
MSLELWQYALLTSVGVIGGFLNVMAGGGSLIMVPVMIFLGIPGPVANGTNRIALLAQNAVAILTFMRKGFSDLKLSLSLAACALPGAVLGAIYGTQLEGAWFNRVVAFIMIGVMLWTWLGPKESALDHPPPTRNRLIVGHLMMVVIGMYGGFIQIGVGFIIMPVLQRVIGMDMVRVNMHKVFVVGVYMIATLAIYASRVEILWMVGVALAMGTSLGGWIGARISISRGEETIKMVLNVVLVVFIIKLLFFT